MNRSILIVICDFLLVSLLTFSTARQRPGSSTREKWSMSRPG